MRLLSCERNAHEERRGAVETTKRALRSQWETTMNLFTRIGAALCVAGVIAPGMAAAETSQTVDTDNAEAGLMAELMEACVSHAGSGEDFRQMDISAWPGLRPMSSVEENENAYIDLRSDGVYVSLALSADECGVKTRSALDDRVLSDAAKRFEALGEVRGPSRDVSGFYVFRIETEAGARYRATVSSAYGGIGDGQTAGDSWVVLTRL